MIFKPIFLVDHSISRQMSESSNLGQLYHDSWSENTVALEKRANTAEKQVIFNFCLKFLILL